jgi:hypothetical protein
MNFVICFALIVVGSSEARNDSCWLSDLVGPTLLNAVSEERSSCVVASSTPLVALLFASSMCDSCVSLRSRLTALNPLELQLILLSRDPNEVRFQRHLRALGGSAVALPFRGADSERVNLLYLKPSLPTLLVFNSQKNSGRLLDSHGYHTLLHLGTEGALRYWQDRASNFDSPDVNHRDLYLSAHPSSSNLLAKLQPANEEL